MPRKNPVPNGEKEIGNRLRSFRINGGFEQRFFARRLGIDRRLLGAYENGRIPIPYYVGQRACEHFEMSARWLVEGRFLQKARYPRAIMETRDIPDRMLFSEAYRKFIQARLPDDLETVLKDGLVNLGVPAERYLELFDSSKSHLAAAEKIFAAFAREHVATKGDSNQAIFFSEMTDFLTKYVQWLKGDEERNRTGRPLTLFEADPEGFFANEELGPTKKKKA